MGGGLIIRESPGKGLGVFAAKAIKKGAIVAYYPDTPAVDVTSDDDYMLHLSEDLNDQRAVTGEPWTGDVPSKKLPLGEKVAHLFNDSNVLRVRDKWMGCKAWWDDVCVYLSTSTANVTRKDGSLCFVATRNIEKDEEILYQYGPFYWMKQYKATLDLNAALETMMRAYATLREIAGKPVPQVPGSRFSLMSNALLLHVGAAITTRGKNSTMTHMLFKATEELCKFLEKQADITPEWNRELRALYKAYGAFAKLMNEV